MKIKIAHIGSYNRNLGDNIALYNVRKQFNEELGSMEIEWISLDILEIFWQRNNNIQFVIEFFKQNTFDAIVVGGGGLIEYRGYEQHDTHYKLPFNEEIMKSLNCPIFFIGVGINYFRGREGFADNALESLKSTISHSTRFSLRNDGSKAILKGLKNVDSDILTKCDVIPDPGLIYDYERCMNKKYVLTENVIQPAFNSSQHINEHRFNGKHNIDYMVEFAKDNKLFAMPHTPKDFKYFEKYVIGQEELKSMLDFNYTAELVKVYLNFESVVALRGHGQLISIGLNIPGLYLSTQDKVQQFSLLNGFEDYNIDINEEDWKEQLRSKHFRLIIDKIYRDNWYDIRNKKICIWKEQFKNFITNCCEDIRKDSHE